MFLEESLESLDLQAVVDIGVPFERWLIQGACSPASGRGVLLIFHVVVRHARQLASLPAEVTLVPGHVQGAEEEQTVGDEGELVDVPHLNWVFGFDHRCKT